MMEYRNDNVWLSKKGSLSSNRETSSVDESKSMHTHVSMGMLGGVRIVTCGGVHCYLQPPPPPLSHS